MAISRGGWEGKPLPIMLGQQPAQHMQGLQVPASQSQRASPPYVAISLFFCRFLSLSPSNSLSRYLCNFLLSFLSFPSCLVLCPLSSILYFVFHVLQDRFSVFSCFVGSGDGREGGKCGVPFPRWSFSLSLTRMLLKSCSFSVSDTSNVGPSKLPQD